MLRGAEDPLLFEREISRSERLGFLLSLLFFEADRILADFLFLKANLFFKVWVLANLGLLLFDLVFGVIIESLAAVYFLLERDLDGVRDLDLSLTEEARLMVTIFFYLSNEIVEPAWMFERLSAGIFFFDIVLEPGLSSRSGISCI